ncbi:MAG: DUF1080 domain-containing protein [Bacteroidetes bacterium]|nr:DUF1080 domain-containing protein [Bacteroidota bacterium]
MKVTTILFVCQFCVLPSLLAKGINPGIHCTPIITRPLVTQAILNLKEAGWDADTIPRPDHQKKSGGWDILFDGKNTGQWRSLKGDSFPSHAWAVEKGTLSVANRAKGEDIITKEEYADFDLRFDFKLTEGANSGIKYFVEMVKDNAAGTMLWNGPEYQIIDDFNHPDVKDNKFPIGSTASLYLIYAPEHKKLFPPGQWNSGRILAKGKHVEQWLNGVKVVSCERGSPDFRNRISTTKFKNYDHYGELPTGHIMLTDHDGDKVYFRNIKIKRLK